jgi:hypothetical protein
VATRYNKTVTVVRPHVIIDEIEEFGKVRRVDNGGGDTMNTLAFQTPAEDRRDATFIRVSSPSRPFIASILQD